jgi:hypothetical protein
VTVQILSPPPHRRVPAAQTKQRRQLALDLKATGIEVHAAWPDRLAPPCIVLAPGSPWVDTTDTTFGEFRGRVDVHLIAATGGTEDALNVLEGALETVLHYTADWAVEAVDAPSLMPVNGTDYLGTTLTLAKPFRPATP